MGKVIHCELYKGLKFDHIDKWYMYKPKSVLVNKTKNSLGLWNTNEPPNSILWPDLVLINKKRRTCYLVDFSVPTDHSESKRRQKAGPCQRTEKKNCGTLWWYQM